MKNRFPIVIVLLIAAVITWLLLNSNISKETKTEIIAKKSYKIDYYLKGMQATTLNALGKPAQKLESENVFHYEDDDTTAFATPIIQVFEEDSNPWEIRAKNGLMSSNGNLVLLKQIVKINKAATSKKPALNMITANLKIRPNDGYAETDEAVRINSGENWLISVGMRAWFKKPSRIKLLADVKGYYAVP